MKLILAVAVTMLATAAIAQTTMTRDGTNGTTGTTPTTSDAPQATGTTGASTTDVGAATNPDSSAMQQTTNESTEKAAPATHGHRAKGTTAASKEGRAVHHAMRHRHKRHRMHHRKPK